MCRSRYQKDVTMQSKYCHRQPKRLYLLLSFYDLSNIDQRNLVPIDGYM